VAKKSVFALPILRHLGLVVFEFIMADSRFDGIPMVLETIDDSIWPEEITFLKGLAAIGRR